MSSVSNPPSIVRRTPRWLPLLGRSANPGDAVFRSVSRLFALLILVLVLAMAAQMAFAAEESFKEFGWGFITSQKWDPVGQRYGALPFIFGTVVSSLLALLLAVPVALGIAIYLSELAPLWLRKPIGFLVELLAAVPSVVYGLWGVFVLAPLMATTVEPALRSTLGFLPLFSGPNQGFGMLSGGVILAIMILPTISSVSREVLQAVPANLREGAIALGATRWEVVRVGVLPYARPGLVGAVILGLGRALGETMAITMLIGNRPEISASLFAPSYTMASVLANEFAEASQDLHLAALAEISLLLFAVTLLLNIVARLLVWQVSRGEAKGAR
ncbi:MAG: phosphate ABC transporter permease subunit PstC [Polyangiaceae bacterium]|nr:phosphate ABC transporter permease subunit PstC [Polyangiaceae bacterium]